jgi:hypothetical protein
VRRMVGDRWPGCLKLALLRSREDAQLTSGSAAHLRTRDQARRDIAMRS